jgi:glycopeptide antibiotics resistance protein
MAPHLSIIVKPRDEIGPNIAPDTDIGMGLCSTSFGLFKHMLSRVLRSRPKVGYRLLIRWTLWLMGIAAIIGFTTMPLSNYVAHAHWDQVSWVPFDDQQLNLPDILRNVALFFPFGYFFPRGLHGPSLKHIWGFPILTAATLSAAVECFQVYTHNRIPSTTDTCANLLGVMLGVLLQRKH